MGIRIKKNVCILPVSLSNKVITIYGFNNSIIKQFSVNVPESISFDKQFNCFYNSSNIMCFMTSDKFKLIMRFNGTLEIISKSNILLFKSTFDVNILSDIIVNSFSCSTLNVYRGRYYSYLFEINNTHYIISSLDLYVSIFLDTTDAVCTSIIELGKFIGGWGAFSILDFDTDCASLLVYFHSNICKPLTKYELYSSYGFIGGV